MNQIRAHGIKIFLKHHTFGLRSALGTAAFDDIATTDVCATVE